jgi:hypothetical protein
MYFLEQNLMMLAVDGKVGTAFCKSRRVVSGKDKIQ